MRDQPPEVMEGMGICLRSGDILTFEPSSGGAGLAGLALSQIDTTSTNFGQGDVIDSFVVVLFGGVGSLWGTLVAAYTLGINRTRELIGLWV